MIRKYHNHKLQTNLWHCEEEPQQSRDTRKTNQSIQLSLSHQDDCTKNIEHQLSPSGTIAKLEWSKELLQRIKTDQKPNYTIQLLTNEALDMM